MKKHASYVAVGLGAVGAVGVALFAEFSHAPSPKPPLEAGARVDRTPSTAGVAPVDDVTEIGDESARIAFLDDQGAYGARDSHEELADPTFVDEWRGLPAAGLAAAYWGMSEAQLRAEVEAEAPRLLPILDNVVGDWFLEIEQAEAEALKEIDATVDRAASAHGEYAFRRAVGRTKSEFIGSIVKRAEARGDDWLTSDSVESDFGVHFASIAEAGARFEKARRAAFASMISTGQYDLYPVVTLESKRTRNARDNGGSHIDFFGTSVGGWIIQVHLFVGDDPVLDQALVDLESQGAALEAAVEMAYNP